jgi:GT2 family glycosyltransferase
MTGAVVISRHELADGSWRSLLDEPAGTHVLIEHAPGTPLPPEIRDAIRGRAASLVFFAERELGPERHRFQCDELAASLGLCRGLRGLAAKTELDLVSIPARDGVAYFALRARRGGLAFSGTQFSLRGQPASAPTCLDRPAAITDHMRRWCSRETSNESRAVAPGVATPGEPGSLSIAGEIVSAIVPVYNLHQYLPEVLASLLGQSRPPDEILIADDGSTDPETLAALARLDEKTVRVLKLPHRGLAATRNAAIREARGAWVLTLDADDLIERTFIELSLAAVRADPALSMVTSLVSCFDESPTLPTGGWCPLGFDRDMLGVFNFASCATALLRRDALLAAGGYDETLPAYEDWDLYCALAERGLSAAVLPEFLVHVRIRPDSMLRTLRRATHEQLRARIAAKHPELVEHPDRALRLLQGEYVRWHDLETQGHEAFFPPDPEALARQIVRKELRYRLADRCNSALKKLGVHAMIKSLLAGR